MASTIITKYGSGAPLASDLVRGELAVDTELGRLYTETSGGAVVEIGLNPGGNLDVTGTVTSDGLTVDGGSVNNDSTAIAGKFNANGNEHIRLEISTDSTIGNQAALDLISNSNTSRIFTTGSTGLKFSTDGGTTSHLVIDGSGNVGIGTEIPGVRLHVEGATDSNVMIVNNIGTAPNYIFDVRDDGVSKFRVDPSGNVGIGTESPSTSLDVVRSGVQPLRIQSTSGTEVAINMVNTGGNVQLEAHSGNFNIDADAVGIGTASPSAKLDIFDDAAGNANSSAIELTNYDYGVGETGQSVSIEALVRNDGGGSSTTGKIVFGKDSDYSSAANRDGNIQFYTNQSNSVTEAMRIDSSGRVGIGVTPSTIWSSSYDALQLGLGGSIYAHDSAASSMGMAANSVYEGTAPNYYDKYLTSSTASKYIQDSGIHSWHTAASGIAGDPISWTEAMRIDASGNLLVGKNSTALGTEGTNLAGTSRVISAGSGNTYHVYDTVGANYPFVVTYQGAVTCLSVTETSDERLKKNITDLPVGLEEIKQLRPVQFDWKDEDLDNGVFGFIAQEVEQTLPSLVTEEIYKEDGETRKAIKKNEITAILVKAIQEQQDLIESLTARIAALEGAN